MGIYRRRLSNGAYHYQIQWADGNRKRHKETYSDRKLAEMMLQQKKKEIETAKVLGISTTERILFEHFCREYLDWAEKNKSSYLRDKGLIENLLTHFRGKYLDEINPYSIEQYRINRQDKVSKATINRESACLKAIFNKSKLWGKFNGDNPVNKIKFYHEPLRIRYLSESELQKLFEVLYGEDTSPTIRNICLCALYCGMRRSEIFNLKWSNIDWQQKTLTVESAYSKGKRSRIIDLNEDFIQVLRTIVEKPGCPYVFYHHEGQRYTDIKKPWRRILKKAGIEDFRLHDLRHCYGTYLRMQGVDLLTIAELMGHQDIRTTTRYAHASREYKRQAVASLGFVYPKVRVRLRGKNGVKGIKKGSNLLKQTETPKSEIAQ